MRYQTIEYGVDEDVATIRLNRPEKMNALSGGMRRELVDALSRAPEEARALVLTGNGPGFCAGQDLGDVKNLGELEPRPGAARGIRAAAAADLRLPGADDLRRQRRGGGRGRQPGAGRRHRHRRALGDVSSRRSRGSG